MRCEIPECKRCLFCVPLRHGIVIFGYLNLIFSLLVLGLESWLNWGDHAMSPTVGIYRGVAMITHMWLPIFLYSLEIIFNIILLIGGHTKHKTYIRAYYYYGIMTTVAMFVILLVVACMNEFNTIGPRFDVLDLTLGLSGFAIHVYLLLLIHSELKKPRYRTGATFLNHVAEVISPNPWSEGRNPL